jgi:hypothetical protein
MKRSILTLAAVCLAGMALAAPAPYPLRVNSRAAKAPDALAFAGHKMSYRVSFYDGNTRSDISSDTPFMSWSTNADAATTVTATYSVVSAPSGIVDFAFAPADLNYDAGTYIYEVGVLDGSGVPNIYRQGTFVLDGSPFGTGVGTNFTTTINWALYSYLATAADGPVRATGTGQTTSTNADGSITINIPAGAISTLLPGIAIDIGTNGTTYTISVDGTESFDASGATNLSPAELRRDRAEGYINDAWADYLNTTQVVFSAGEGYCNGSYWQITADATSTVTTLAAGEDFHYGLIDDDASSYPAPTIIWSTTEPVYNALLNGWYIGNDRCIFVVYSPGTGATISYFTACNGRYEPLATLGIASSMTPDGTWQTPDDAESSTKLPVNVCNAKFWYQAADSGQPCYIGLAAKERSDNQSGTVQIDAGWFDLGYNALQGHAWVGLGVSRNVRLQGQNDDDPNVNVNVVGWEIER